MDQRISFVTLAARDLGASRAFYVDGLGWTPELEVPGEVLMLRAGEHLVLSLWDRTAFEAEIGPIADGGGPIVLAHNVATRPEVDEVVDLMRRAGGEVVREPDDREWGGASAYVADPDGHRWEIAYNPGQIGSLVLP